MGTMELSTEDLVYVRDLIRKRSAIVLDSEKAYLVQSRLEPVATGEGLKSLRELILKLRLATDGRLHNKVVEALTTNETSFFRDVVPFQILKDQLLPEIIKQNSFIKRLHIWCGASSSGQEPYSIIFTILEHFPELKNWPMRVLATDISQEMIKRGQEGTYGQWEIDRGLPPHVLNKYFCRKGTKWQVRGDVRSMIEFREMNLAGWWLNFPRMDLVFLRNVLMYFDMETKKKILKNVRGILEPHGYLLLGASETTMNVDDRFQPVAVNGTSVYRIRKE